MEALKITENIIRVNAFEHKKKKTRVKFNSRLNANRPSNNWAQHEKSQVTSAEMQPQQNKVYLNFRDSCQSAFLVSLFLESPCIVNKVSDFSKQNLKMS